MTSRRTIFCLLFFGLTAVSPRARAQAPDSIRGTIRTDSGAVIAGADVVVTRAPDRTSLFTKTDAEGRYLIVFDSATGDYLVHASAVGRTSARRRVTRVGNEHSFVVDFKLASGGVQQMEPVRVSTSKPVPYRRPDGSTETGEAGKFPDGVNAAVPADLIGDLNATALAMPGVSLTPGGVSVLGLEPSQNSATLNGMAFAGTDVPRDAAVRIKTTTSTYDPARGGFAGLQTNIELWPGTLITSRRASLVLDAPALQYGDRSSPQLGQRFTNIQLGAGSNGEFFTDKFAYNIAANIAHRFSDAVSLLNADPALLQHTGLSVDSLANFSTLAVARGIPLAGSAPVSAVTDVVNVIARLDHNPYDFNTLMESKKTWGVTGYAKTTRSSAIGYSPTSSPGFGGHSLQSTLGVQAVVSRYLGKSYLTNLSSGFSVNNNRTEPYLRIPRGNVLISSRLPDGTEGSTLLSFGGNGYLDSDRRQWTWETTDETLFYVSGHETHRVKLNADSRIDGFTSNPGNNGEGTFWFNSLSDFAANLPASFTRTLASPVRKGSEWNGFAALGDFWRISQTLQVLYGARIEGNRFLASPAYNPLVDNLFDVRTDHVPNTIHISPRLGFSWVRSRGGSGFGVSRLGIYNLAPPGYLRGGIGEFRNTLDASLLIGPLAATGLPGASRDLRCIGAAVPIPNWAAYSGNLGAIPAQCLSAGGLSELSDSARAVSLIGRGYEPPRSWRANLGYSSTIGDVSYSVDGTYSLNLDQPGRVDLNFTGAPMLTLNGEGRPVFVSAGSIVPATGGVSPVDARKTNQFASVMSMVSDSRSISKQMLVTVQPFFNTKHALRASYALLSMRAYRSGFDAPTFGNPLLHSWARGDFDVRHQFQIQTGQVVKGVALTLSTRIQSGLPYTPLIGGDVNGDGLSNDRAFIFNPASVSDAALGSATQRLLSSVSPKVRRCLESQLGKPAGLNSCEGPWTAALDAQLDYTLPAPVLASPRSVTLSLYNSLGALDQLIHGSNHLRGWGAAASPDPVLYNVRGFDPVNQAFKYEVNPRFGNTNPANTAFRVPFRATLKITIPLNAPFQFQVIDRWLGPGRAGRPGHKITPAELKARFIRNINDPYARIIDESDSLLLNPAQVRAIQAVDSAYRVRIDSVWAPFSDSVAALPDKFEVKPIVQQMEALTDSAWEITRRDVQSNLPKILSPVQLKILPGMAAYLYNSKGPVGIRTYYFGS